ncbi:OmpA family protein [Methylobacterium sp. Leaf93]|uniref:OmpA family protein n=1 Tax=Methylobacterium sp. Leaf93 TaxID=1736249 RepID=UPI0009E69C07|nr:OmpA family protein [Methylobacterium sp. Leaf93]
MLPRLLCVLAMVWPVCIVSVQAQVASEDQIAKALTPMKTRSLSIGAPTTAVVGTPGDAAFVDSLRNKNSHSLSTSAREKLKIVAADKPAIDLVMEFDFGSETLRGEAKKTAEELGKVLARPEFIDQTFVIAGHTDAKGSDTANQRLSEQRAEAVKRFLVQAYKIPAANLIAVGYGKTRLKNESAPFSEENRRVQAVNLLQVRTASR